MRNSYHWTWTLPAGILLAAVSFGAAEGQNSVANWPSGDYKVDKFVQVQFPGLGPVIRAGEFADDDEQNKFVDFFNQSVFPNITRLDNRQASREDVIAKLRGYLRACDRGQKQQVYGKLCDITLDYMLERAGSASYHPAVRANAMLAIGELNSLRAAKTLLDTAFANRYPMAIRVAAMSGLVRMAGPSGKGVLAADPEFEAKVVKSMAIVVKVKKGAGADGINWMRSQAADVLAGLESTGNNGEVPPALLVMLDDTQLSIPLRSKAASALGKLNYGGNPPAAGPYLKGLAALADEALASDVHSANRARVREVAHDVLEGMKPFEQSNNVNDVQVIDVLKKALVSLNKETEAKMDADELKTAVTKAKTAIDGIAKTNG